MCPTGWMRAKAGTSSCASIVRDHTFWMEVTSYRMLSQASSQTEEKTLETAGSIEEF